MRVALIVIGAAVMLLPGLGESTLWSRDETTYADIARTMLGNGDWMTLHWNGRPWLNHPPLFYWLMALDFHLLGVSELTARLPAAIFGVAGVVLTYTWGLTFMSPRGATVAALALLLNIQYFLESRMAIIDSTFLFFLSLSLLGFWMGWRGQRRGWGVFFTACGCACLAKGPWGLVFPLVVIVPFTILAGGLGRLREAPWQWGVPLTLTVGGGWYVLGAMRHGRVFVDTVLGYYFLGRVTTQVEHQGGPVWMYVPVLLAGFLPWSFLLPAALRDLWRRRGEDDSARLLLCWIGVPFVGLSLASTKLPSYAGFLLPPCALAVGALIDRLTDRRALGLPLGLAALFSLMLGFAVAQWGPRWVAIPAAGFASAQAAFTLMGIGLTLAVLAALTSWRLPSPMALAAAGSAAFLVIVSLCFVPALEPTRSLRAVAAAVRDTSAPQAPRAFYGPGVFGVIYYADVGPLEELTDASALRRWLDVTPHGVLVMRRDTFAGLAPDMAARLATVAVTEREIVTRVR